MIKKKNSAWDINKKPTITIITPVYNRLLTIQRTINSVLNQDFKDFEYIIVDDGSISCESIDDLIDKLFEKATFPVLFIKKANGGVHTARNVGIDASRGELILFLDSDDEITSNCLSVLHKKWTDVPKNSMYREIVAQCMDENGNRIGLPFPPNINKVSHKRACKMCRKTRGEHVSLQLSSVLKENKFPEFEGVSFITENALWTKLENEGYRSWYINDMVRIYHLDSSNSLIRNKVKNEQTIYNSYNECAFFLNNWNFYRYGLKARAEYVVRFLVFEHFISSNRNKIKLINLFDKMLSIILFLPSLLVTFFYSKRINKTK